MSHSPLSVSGYIISGSYFCDACVFVCIDVVHKCEPVKSHPVLNPDFSSWTLVTCIRPRSSVVHLHLSPKEQFD